MQVHTVSFMTLLVGGLLAGCDGFSHEDTAPDAQAVAELKAELETAKAQINEHCPLCQFEESTQTMWKNLRSTIGPLEQVADDATQYAAKVLVDGLPTDAVFPEATKRVIEALKDVIALDIADQRSVENQAVVDYDDLRRGLGKDKANYEGQEMRNKTKYEEDWGNTAGGFGKQTQAVADIKLVEKSFPMNCSEEWVTLSGNVKVEIRGIQARFEGLDGIDTEAINTTEAGLDDLSEVLPTEPEELCQTFKDMAADATKKGTAELLDELDTLRGDIDGQITSKPQDKQDEIKEKFGDIMNALEALEKPDAQSLEEARDKFEEFTKLPDNAINIDEQRIEDIIQNFDAKIERTERSHEQNFDVGCEESMNKIREALQSKVKGTRESFLTIVENEADMHAQVKEFQVDTLSADSKLSSFFDTSSCPDEENKIQEAKIEGIRACFQESSIYINETRAKDALSPEGTRVLLTGCSSRQKTRDNELETLVTAIEDNNKALREATEFRTQQDEDLNGQISIAQKLQDKLVEARYPIFTLMGVDTAPIKTALAELQKTRGKIVNLTTKKWEDIAKILDARRYHVQEDMSLEGSVQFEKEKEASVRVEIETEVAFQDALKVLRIPDEELQGLLVNATTDIDAVTTLPAGPALDVAAQETWKLVSTGAIENSLSEGGSAPLSPRDALRFLKKTNMLEMLNTEEGKEMLNPRATLLILAFAQKYAQVHEETTQKENDTASKENKEFQRDMEMTLERQDEEKSDLQEQESGDCAEDHPLPSFELVQDGSYALFGCPDADLKLAEVEQASKTVKSVVNTLLEAAELRDAEKKKIAAKVDQLLKIEAVFKDALASL